MVSPLSNNSIPVTSFNYNERVTELQSKIRKFETQLGMDPSSIALELVPFSSDCETRIDQERYKIFLPSWFLFCSQDIPDEFRIASQSGSVSHDLLKALAKWINQYLSQVNNDLICCFDRDCEELHLFFLGLKKPGSLEKWKDFIIAHEMAHAAYYDQRKRALKACYVTAMRVSIIGFLFFIVSVPFSGEKGLGVAHALSAGGSALIACVSHSLWRIREKFIFCSGEQEEKRADLEAVRILGTAEGGIDHLQAVIYQNLLWRNYELRNGGVSSCDPQGNLTEDTDHPFLTERLAYLRVWQGVG